MRIRGGFVSNSSSCSFILVLPENKADLDRKSFFIDWFGLKNLTDHEVKRIQQAMRNILTERSEKDNYALIIRYVGQLIDTDGWMKNNQPETYDEYHSATTELLNLLMGGSDLLFMEIGDSYEYEGTELGDPRLEEDLSNEKTASKIFTEHSFVFNNR